MAAGLTGSYDPSKVVCIVGSVIVSGFSDGDAIIARMSEERNFVRVGLGGSVSKARNSNKTGEFEFRLLQTGEINDQLSALFAIDDLTNDGNIVLPISITDGSGRSFAVATQCWLKEAPEATFGKEVSERIWVFTAADLRIFHGGNNV